MYFSGRVVSIERLSSTMYMAEIRLLDRPRERPRPFQFVMLWVPGTDSMPMSVADYEDGLLRIVFKIRGEGTRALARGPVFVGVSGFYGRGLEGGLGERVLFVAGGSGIAPLPYLLREADGGEVDVVWGVRSSDELFDIKRLVPRERIGRVFLASEDCVGEGVYCGRATDLLRELTGSRGLVWDTVIGSGPTEMLATMCRILGDTDPYVSLEAYVKCGMGFCGSCLLRPLRKLLCVDGPVFRCSEVREYLESYMAEVSRR